MTCNVTLRGVHATTVQPKATSIIYSGCEFIALGLQQAMCLRHIVVCCLTGCKIIFHYLKKTKFSKKKDIEQKM
jgi:hypothetical protein